MDNEMTVLGFGRNSPSLDAYLKGQNEFTIGLLEFTTLSGGQLMINSAYRDVTVKIGK